MKRKGRILGAEEIERGLGAVTKRLDDLRVSWALIGGVAMQLYGSRRLTADVDLVVDRARPEALSGRVGRLSFGGLRGKVSGVPVDLVERDDEYAELYEEALGRARTIDGRRVVEPAHLAAIKMAAARPKDEDDLRFLMTEVLDGVGRTVARRIVCRYLGTYAAREWDASVVEAFWRRKVGR